MGYALRDTAHYTYGDYRRWNDDERYELIDGIAYLMAPTPTVNHQSLAFEIAHQVRTALEGAPCRVFVAPVDVLLGNAEADDDTVATVVQPDVLVVCDARKIRSHGVRGAPDWVAEVLSPSSSSHDQTVKLTAYERAGVPEYWLAHPVDRVLTIYRLIEGGYGRPTIVEKQGETAVGVLPGVVIRWPPILASLLPEAD